MILHIFPENSEKFGYSLIKFLNSHFARESNYFVVVGNQRWNNIFDKKDNINFINNINEIDKDVIKQANKIILHSFFTKHLVSYMLFHKKYNKKSIWIIWGGDLYPYLSHKNFKAKIYNFFRRIVIKRLKGIASLVYGDFKIAQEKYDFKGKYYQAIYYSEQKNEQLLNLEYKPIDKMGEIKIIIGNSATRSNNHAEILQILKKWKSRNIKIYCPLSYGDMNYAEYIKNLGRQYFGDKFEEINRFLPLNEYNELLNEMDIGIFNSDRQQGLGNIYPLLLLKKKIYIRRDTSMWEELHNREKIELFAIENIKNEKFDEFIYSDDQMLNNNKEKIIKRNSSQNAYKIWQKLLKEE